MHINKIVQQLGIKAKIASFKLSNINSDIKNKALKTSKDLILSSISELLEINKKDIDHAIKNNLSTSMIDRLTLNKERIENIALSLDEIIKLEDPIGKIISEWKRPNGLHFQKISVPIGVIGVSADCKPTLAE